MQARVSPWSGTAEWRHVAGCLFGGDVLAVREGVLLGEAWCVRGNAPPAVETTVNLGRLKLSYEDALLDARSMRLAASSAIVRFVNEVVEPGQKAVHALPVSQLAERMNVPRLLVDLRHQATHDVLPSLEVLLVAVEMALDWLRENYWRPCRDFEEAVREATLNTLQRFADAASESVHLKRPIERAAARAIGEIQHVESSSEIQRPFLQALVESPHQMDTLLPLLDVLGQRDESAVCAMLACFLSSGGGGTRMLAALERLAIHVKKTPTIAACARQCLDAPAAENGRRALAAILKAQKAEIPHSLALLMSSMILDRKTAPAPAAATAESLLLRTGVFLAEHQPPAAASTECSAHDDWFLLPATHRALPFGQTDAFNPATDFAKLIVSQ